METPNTPSTSQEIPGKEIAIISYLTLVGLVIAFILNSEKKHEFARYHIRQSLGIAVTAIALYAVCVILSFVIIGVFLMPLVAIFVLVLAVIGLINAINGKQAPVPVLGTKYEEWFKNI